MRIITLAVVGGIALIGCTPSTEKTAVTPTEAPQSADGGVVPWAEAVTLINNGDVDTAAQSHSLGVSLFLKDGRMITTTEPEIDAIFREIDRCGPVCADIALISE